MKSKDQLITDLNKELEYYEGLIKFLCERVPCLEFVIDDFLENQEHFEFTKGDE